MIISYSLIMAVLLFNLAMVVIALLRRRTGFLQKYSTSALVLLALIAALRLMLPLSFPFTYVVNSFEVLPNIKAVLGTDVLPGVGGFELRSMIRLIWAAGSLFMLFRLVRRILKERSYRQRYRVVISAQAERVAQSLRLGRTIIIVTPDVVVPYVTGILRARIYLPDIAMDDRVLEHILKHEYQHFKSRDALIKAFYILLSIVFWWNPIVHFFLRDLDRLLEVRCDETITKRIGEDEKTMYLESLLSIAKHVMEKSNAEPAGAPAFVRAGQTGFMEQRVSLILREKHLASAIKQIVSVALVVVVFIASFMVVVQPAYWPPEYETGEYFSITPENAYVSATKDGRYMLYVNGFFIQELDEDMLDTKFIVGLPIIYEDG